TSNLRAVRPVVATDSAVTAALKRVYGADTGALEMVDALGDSDVTTIHEDADLDDLTLLAEGAAEQPVVRLANAILADAVRTRSSDIHVEPARDGVRVRYRIDGLLREKMRVPRHIGPALISRLKIISQLDIAERRRPQDGRSMVRVEGQEVDLRVSTMPTMYGETVVLRLLRKGEERLLVQDLGMAPDDRATYESALIRPQGLIILTGPTGSGKTTTLYAGLTRVADPVRNVLTLEDPIEYQLEGVNQTQINPKIGLTFARGLRTVLRQDPDVVMVGEIRDDETAELAMEASFTGHLVLSTLHTNDAPSTIVRLVDLGVERFLIASSLVLVVAQRLVRVNCPHCREPDEPDPKVVRLLGLTPESLSDIDLVRGAGCQICERTGYVGRTAVYELLQISPQIRDLIVEGAGQTALTRLARVQGMRTLREDGLARAFAGQTTLEEILRTTPEESTNVLRCPTCNFMVGDGFAVCPNCNSDLADARSTTSTAYDLIAAATSVPRVTADGQIATAGQQAARVDPSDQDATPQDSTRDGRAADAPRVKQKKSAQELAADLAVRATKGAGDGDGDTSEVADLRGHTVLVVDDDASVRSLLTTLLDEVTVHEAEDGHTAIAKTIEFEPDAIILDYKLPDIDGIEVARVLREDPRTRHVAILMITGVLDPEVEVEGLLAGVDDFLTKPFDEDVLRMRLRSAVLRAAAPAKRA
ncbi:MAG TPA: ATPase, T2SS/T4P/T4SS family, partial [Nitriliruptorales bacterium]